MIQGFHSFLTRTDMVVAAVALAVALAFSTLIQAFTRDILYPIVNFMAGPPTSGEYGFTVQLGPLGNPATALQVGDLISALVSFAVFMLVIYAFIVVPYRSISARFGRNPFADPAPVKTCPFCLSGDLPAPARKCRHCGADQPPAEAS